MMCKADAYTFPNRFLPGDGWKSAKERGLHDKGDYFVLVLRKSDDPYKEHNKVSITKEHFEQITGLKALSKEEYYQKCETAPFYEAMGATLIDLLALSKS